MSIVVSQPPKFRKKTQKKSEEETFLARETFSAFLPYIDPVFWGINKLHSITKAEHVACAKWCDERNRGVDKPKIEIVDEHGEPWTKDDGSPVFFNFYLNYKRKLWNSDAIQRCLDADELHYFISAARSGKKLVYLDLDCHHDWQDDLPDAVALIKELFGENAFWRSSHRGYNGWLKIGDAPSANEYNAGLARMERVLRNVFLQSQIRTEIEVKGRSVWGKIRSFDDRRSQLAKMPCWNHRYFCNRKNEDDCWNIRRMEEFKAKPNIRWASLMAGIDQLEQKLDPQRVEEGRRLLQSIKDPGCISVTGEQRTVVQDAPDVVPAEQTKAESDEATPSPQADLSRPPVISTSKPGPESLNEIRQITDAFVRNREFALYACRPARRPRSADELLEQDRLNHIFHGTWDDGLADRKRRYQQIAPFVARTFDAAKCGNGKSQRPVLDSNLRDWRARAVLFPSKAIGYVGKREKMVERHVLIGLTAIIQTASKPNGDCPRDSIQGWWEELAAEGKLPAWNVDLYTAARSVLVRYQIVIIDHLRYQFVPDAKGQCKGIWIRKQKTVGRKKHTFPLSSISLINKLLSFTKHKGYDAVEFEKFGCSRDFTDPRPPP